MKYINHFMAVIAMSAILIACNNSSGLKVQDDELAAITADTTAIQNASGLQQDDRQMSTADTLTEPSGVHWDNSITKNDNPDWDKKIIKTADVQLQLDDYKKFNTSIHSLLKNFGAYIAGEKQTQNDYRIENTITIKVPVGQFDALVNSFAGDGITVTEKNISSQDVTGEAIDTKSRMQAKMAVRDKYLQLLKQAKNMDEILQVQNEINNVQEDIEAANGRVGYLQHASAYSTIKLNYFQYTNGSSVNDEKPDFFTKFSKAFSTGTSVITNLVLFCITIWPLILIGLFIWLYLKRMKLKRPVKA